MNDISEPWREYQRLEARITRPGLYLSRVQYLPLICINTRSRVRRLIAVQQSRWSQSTFDQYRPNHIRSCEASHSRASLSPQRDCLRTRRTSPVRLLGRSRLVVSFPANVGRPEVDTAVSFPRRRLWIRNRSAPPRHCSGFDAYQGTCRSKGRAAGGSYDRRAIVEPAVLCCGKRRCSC